MSMSKAPSRKEQRARPAFAKKSRRRTRRTRRTKKKTKALRCCFRCKPSRATRKRLLRERSAPLRFLSRPQRPSRFPSSGSFELRSRADDKYDHAAVVVAAGHGCCWYCGSSLCSLLLPMLMRRKSSPQLLRKLADGWQRQLDRADQPRSSRGQQAQKMKGGPRRGMKTMRSTAKKKRAIVAASRTRGESWLTSRRSRPCELAADRPTRAWMPRRRRP